MVLFQIAGMWTGSPWGRAESRHSACDRQMLNVVGQSNRESVLDVIQVSESGENSHADVKMEFACR